MNCITNWEVYHIINRTKEKTIKDIVKLLRNQNLSRIKNLKEQDNDTNHLPETNTD